MNFHIDESTMIPVASGQAVKSGWEDTPFGRAVGVTMHWAVTATVAGCTKIIGGANATRKGVASAHYCVGRSFTEGTARYVSLANRSFHCQLGQILRWDGQTMGTKQFSGINTTIGIETAHLGFATEAEVGAGRFVVAAAPNGVPMEVQLWTDEQIDMIIAIGKEIVERFPDIRPRDWHGHHDLAPKRKIDVTGFPFARVLRGVYGDDSIPDVWTVLWDVTARQKALIAVGHPLEQFGADGGFGTESRRALVAFQRDNNMVANGFWSTFTCWKVHDILQARGSTIEEAIA